MRGQHLLHGDLAADEAMHTVDEEAWIWIKPVFLDTGLIGFDSFAAVSVWIDALVWMVALGLVFGAFASLWVSRRVAGPFYRIEKDLESILYGASQGQLVQLREGDPLRHLADLVNELIERARK